MLYKKGFSLIEVLVSLFLISTVAFSLMQCQWHAKELFSQFISHVNATHYADEAKELLYLREVKKNA